MERKKNHLPIVLKIMDFNLQRNEAISSSFNPSQNSSANGPRASEKESEISKEKTCGIFFNL